MSSNRTEEIQIVKHRPDITEVSVMWLESLSWVTGSYTFAFLELYKFQNYPGIASISLSFESEKCSLEMLIFKIGKLVL